MKNIKILSFVALVIMSATLFSSCKKYEEGPGISLRSKTARISNHWKIEKALWNGDDITEFTEGTTFEFNKDNTYTLYDAGIAEVNGKWALIDSKEKLELMDNNTPEDKISYTIIKLKEKEMKWQYEEDDDVYEYTFVPK